MEEIERLVEELSITSLEMDSVHSVVVTHSIDPLNFYVRLVKYRPIIEIMEYMEPKPSSADFNVKDLVVYNVARSRVGRRYIRGRITDTSQMQNFSTCDVFALDYGFTEKLIPVDYVWHCSTTLKNIPPLAWNCQLANCYPLDIHGFSIQSIYAFRYYAGIKRVQLKVLGIKTNKILVELLNSKTEDISTLLATHGHITLGYYSGAMTWNPIIGGKALYFTFKKASVGKTLRVRVQSGNSLQAFHAVEVRNYRRYLDDIGAITYYANKEFYLSPKHFVEGRLVCVKNNKHGNYERAFIKKVKKPFKRAIVKLVDSGKRAECHIRKMKYMPLKCLRIPVVSMYCRADENQAWDNGLHKFLTPGFEFMTTIKYQGHEFEHPYYVDIFPLARK